MSFDLKLLKGDLVLNNSGQVKIVQRNSKIRQDILKILLTDIGENKFHYYYGCKAGKLNIGSVLDQEFHRAKIEESVMSSLKNLISLQSAQSKYQYVSPAERILSISSVEAGRDETDPRMWNVFISVLTLEQEEVVETLAIRI